LLKLHTIRPPFVIRPAVAGAIARPYGFWPPFSGSTVDPRVVIVPAVDWVPAVDRVVRREGETVTAGVVTEVLAKRTGAVATAGIQMRAGDRGLCKQAAQTDTSDSVHPMLIEGIALAGAAHDTPGEKKCGAK
jgi:hypothetical protein